MDYEDFIIKKLLELSGQYNSYQIFSDWVRITALSIQNACVMVHNDIYQRREQDAINTMKKYSNEQLKTMADMTGALAITMEERMRDVLGAVFMKAGCGSSATGQFFTPYHLSLLTAKVAYEEKFKDIEGYIDVNEPSSGGGGMMIAIAQVLKDNGVDYQRKLRVVAQDLDWNGVYMTYIQLSLLGINAIVKQGDTLAAEQSVDKFRILETPARMGAIF